MIRQLDAQLVNKIAAGEVVERPLSVVKELVENAIDAGAGVITVEIKEGGLSLIRVTDNGGGIPADQVMLAFSQHATSKIQDIDDLSRIGTLGFRGEALASIASVAHVEMVTKPPGASAGVRVELHGGTLVNRQEVGCVDGTSIKCSNLFFNTPARLKFLKKPVQEAGYVSDLMQRLALGYPHLSFRYINNGHTIVATNGNGDLRAVIHNIYGKEAARGLIPVENEPDNFIYGYIGRPDIARKSRNAGNFFINGRYIKNKLLQDAVEEVYRNHLPNGNFPLFVLCLNIPPEDLDVNVHPAKLEVRFADDKAIYVRVVEAIKRGLSRWDLTPAARPASKIVPSSAVQSEMPQNRQLEQWAKSFDVSNIDDIRDNDIKDYDIKDCDIKDYNIKDYDSETFDYAGPMISMSEEWTGSGNRRTSPELTERPEIIGKSHDFEIITQVFNTYWLAVRDEELFLIDQHAAHEKVLYEEIFHRVKSEKPHSQPLLEPENLNLSPSEIAAVLEHKHVFCALGFEFDDSGSLLAMPSLLTGLKGTAFFSIVLEKLEKNPEDTLTEIMEKEVAMAACKAAVRAKDSLSIIEAHSLVNRMLALENPYFCPHGRPTMISMSKREIEKKFKRT